MHVVCKDKPAILNYVLHSFPLIYSKNMSLLYPGLNREYANPIEEIVETHKILAASKQAAAELVAHREAHKDDAPSAPEINQVDIDELLDEESENEAEESYLPLYEPHILARWAQNLMEKFSARPKVQLVEFTSERRPAPAYANRLNAYDKGWRGLLGSKQNTKILVQNGLMNVNAARLMENNLSIVDFRTMKYAPVQMRNIFTSLEQLKAAGFTGSHMDSCCWKLGDFAIAYSVDPVELAKEFKLDARRLLEVGVAPGMLHEYDVTLEDTIAKGSLVDLAYMGGFTCAELAQALHVQPHELFVSSPQDIRKITPSQARLLMYCVPGWNVLELNRAGLDRETITRIGVGVRIKSS